MRILMLTVGGSHEPLVRSIQDTRPDEIVFLCSRESSVVVAGEGKVNKSNRALPSPDLPAVPVLLNLDKDRYSVTILTDCDDLSSCYLESSDALRSSLAKHAGADVIVDYTGGTKTLTAALAMAGCDEPRCRLQLVVGRRPDLQQVQSSTEFAVPVEVYRLRAERGFATAEQILRTYAYGAAAAFLRESAAAFAAPGLRDRFQQRIQFCEAMDAWDRFDHEAARDRMRGLPGLEPYSQWLGLTLSGKGHGFELVEDLVLNAERRASQGRYDDAFGRLYRAVELTAQKRLSAVHQIDTGNVDCGRLPEPIGAKMASKRSANGKVQVGLVDAWEILASLEDSSIVQRYRTVSDRLKTFLTVRNSSLFAHGDRPVTKVDADKWVPLVASFLRHCVESAARDHKGPTAGPLAQLPTAWPET